MELWIYIQDLKEESQLTLFEEVRFLLLASGYISPQESGETSGAYERRVSEEVDDYLNRHNKLKITL